MVVEKTWIVNIFNTFSMCNQNSPILIWFQRPFSKGSFVALLNKL